MEGPGLARNAAVYGAVRAFYDQSSHWASWPDERAEAACRESSARYRPSLAVASRRPPPFFWSSTYVRISGRRFSRGCCVQRSNGPPKQDIRQLQSTLHRFLKSGGYETTIKDESETQNRIEIAQRRPLPDSFPLSTCDAIHSLEARSTIWRTKSSSVLVGCPRTLPTMENFSVLPLSRQERALTLRRKAR